MPGSIAVAVRTAVIAGIKARLAALVAFNTGADEVEVTYAWTASSEANQQIYTGRASADTPPAAMRSGRNLKNETGTFELTILVRRPGDLPEDAEARAWLIGAEVEEYLGDRKSNQLGVTGLQTLIITRWASDYRVSDLGAVAILTYTVQWTARIT